MFTDKKDTNSVSRRSVLQGATIVAGGVAMLATTMTTQRAEAAKMSQKVAGYQDTPKDGLRCDGCASFQAPSSCKTVDGTVSPSGYCRFFKKP